MTTTPALPRITGQRRLPALAAVIALVALLAGAASFRPARATTQTGFEVSADKAFSGTFAPLVGNDAKAALNFNPTFCATVTFCDVIPFKVIRPEGVDPDTLTLSIELSWDDPTTTNDLDMDIYDNQELGDTYVRLTRAESTSNPERVRLARVSQVDYNLVVRNVLGVNIGYSVKASLSTKAFTSPIELLATKREAPRQEPAPVESRPAETLPPPEPAVEAAPPPTLAPVPVSADTDFDFGDSGFEDQLAAPPAPGGGAIAPAPEKPAKVGGGVVALWFVVAPAALLGATGLFVARRRRGDLA
ncbi:MAG TPA: hypothetical protein VM030_10015 [Acidimicrobiales bacterium]|nr:hypothetical protein [Acidimicrobiales bacterium]